MKRALATVAGGIALALPLSLLAASPAAAAKPSDPGKGGRCVAAGTSVLASNGLMPQAAKGTLDYSGFGSQEGGAGLIRLEFDGEFKPALRDVIALHRTAPQLFAWCDNV
jgi:hypothetical protein